MEQRLRLVQGGQPRTDKRVAERRRIAVPGQIVWKDAKGTTRMAAVVTRDVSEHGVSVDCLGGMPIPGTGADFGWLLAEETQKWAKVVKFAGIKAE